MREGAMSKEEKKAMNRLGWRAALTLYLGTIPGERDGPGGEK